MIGELVAGAHVLLAEAGPSNAPEGNPEWGKAAPTGLFVLLAFVVVCIFLFRSMNRHIRKVPGNFGGKARQQQTEDLAGKATSAVPTVESVDLSTQTPPRLGTPTQLATDQKAKRAEQIRKAKAKVNKDRDK
ncbi:hypothetical protein [Cumulibacter soli]|uniref:hypothetical protein n=1 Tax=Cumulibacter soli TaxID=2546344 RepID=UPI001068952E|nr:hypothetical protein [Cumulibacter soli]